MSFFKSLMSKATPAEKTAIATQLMSDKTTAQVVANAVAPLLGAISENEEQRAKRMEIEAGILERLEAKAASRTSAKLPRLDTLPEHTVLITDLETNNTFASLADDVYSADAAQDDEPNCEVPKLPSNQEYARQRESVADKLAENKGQEDGMSPPEIVNAPLEEVDSDDEAITLFRNTQLRQGCVRDVNDANARRIAAQLEIAQAEANAMIEEEVVEIVVEQPIEVEEKFAPYDNWPMFGATIAGLVVTVPTMFMLRRRRKVREMANIKLQFEELAKQKPVSEWEIGLSKGRKLQLIKRYQDLEGLTNMSSLGDNALEAAETLLPVLAMAPMLFGKKTGVTDFLATALRVVGILKFVTGDMEFVQRLSMGYGLASMFAWPEPVRIAFPGPVTGPKGWFEINVEQTVAAGKLVKTKRQWCRVDRVVQDMIVLGAVLSFAAKPFLGTKKEPTQLEAKKPETAPVGQLPQPVQETVPTKGCCHTSTCPQYGKIKIDANSVCNYRCGGHHCTHWSQCKPAPQKENFIFLVGADAVFEAFLYFLTYKGVKTLISLLWDVHVENRMKQVGRFTRNLSEARAAEINARRAELEARGNKKGVKKAKGGMRGFIIYPDEKYNFDLSGRTVTMTGKQLNDYLDNYAVPAGLRAEWEDEEWDEDNPWADDDAKYAEMDRAMDAKYDQKESIVKPEVPIKLTEDKKAPEPLKEIVALPQNVANRVVAQSKSLKRRLQAQRRVQKLGEELAAAKLEAAEVAKPTRPPLVVKTQPAKEAHNGRIQVNAREMAKRCMPIYHDKECKNFSSHLGIYRNVVFVVLHEDKPQAMWYKSQNGKPLSLGMKPDGSTRVWKQYPDNHLWIARVDAGLSHVPIWSTRIEPKNGLEVCIVDHEALSSESKIRPRESAVDGATQVMSYEASTRVGNCGAVVFSTSVTNPNCLVGVHIANRHFALLPKDEILVKDFPNY